MKFHEVSLGGLSKVSFDLLKNDLLTAIAINGKLSDALKRLYTIVYREDHLSWGDIFVSKNIRGKFRRGNVLSTKVSIGGS